MSLSDGICKFRKDSMNKRVITAGLACLPLTAFAWQGGMAAIGVTETGLQSKLERATRQKGDGLTLSLLGPKELAAAMALSEPQQAALMKELALAAKAIVMSPAFQSAHEAYIAKEYKAVNHGLKVKTLEQAAQQANSKDGAAELDLKMKREMAAVYVQFAMQAKIEDLKMMFDESVKDWTKEANKPKGSDKAKYAKLVAKAQAIKDLSVSDPDKFRRGYAVLRSAENDGLDTEEALFGAQASGEKDNEQLMWDQHNLRGALKRVLAQAVAEAPTVDFAAQTVQKGSTRVFVNPAYEKKSLTWKAMYRAGKGPTAAGLEVARAWLKEL
jgi:hypothetical protein